MGFETDLRAVLRAAVPGVPCDWGWNLQGVEPTRVVLTLISGSDPLAHDGPVGLVQRRVQVDVFARLPGDAMATGHTIRRAASGYRGGAIAKIEVVALRDGPPETPAGTTLARRSLDLMVHYIEE